jgi:regulatory protein
MLITAIEPRRKSMSALYIDGEFAMLLDTQTLIENRFKVGREIDDDDLQEIINLSNERRAKEKALWLISYRDHSKKELADKIKRTYDEQSAEKAVERLEELGLVNDEGFARRYAEQLIFSKRMSKKAAAYELARKGIDRELSDEILEGIDLDTKENIRAVLERKYRNISDEKTKRRAVSALQRLGYGWDDIKSVIEEYTNFTED